MAGFFVAQATAVSSGIPICVTAVRMQSARFVTEPANAPSETRVALFPVTFTSSPPNVYCPSGIPVALILSLINIIRSAPIILNAALIIDGWICTPSQMISDMACSSSNAAPTTPGSLCVKPVIALNKCTT